MKNGIKKTMTKKELKKYYALKRSRVGMGRNLDTITHNNKKNYDRNEAKRQIQKDVSLL